MFILIPVIIIFLLLTYLYLNEVGLVGQVFIYSLVFFVVAISLFLYKSIKKDMLQQKIHRLEADVLALEKKIMQTSDEIRKKQILNKIEQLQQEIASKLQNK
jgi:uncharacterized membrane protein